MAMAQNLQEAITNMLRNIANNHAVSAYGENLDNMLGYLNLDIPRQKSLTNGYWLEITEPLFEVLNKMRADTRPLFITQSSCRVYDAELARTLFSYHKEELKTLLLDLQASFE